MGHLDYERALAETRAALQLRPRDPAAVFLQASVNRRAGQIEEAARLYERVVAVDPGSAEKCTTSPRRTGSSVDTRRPTAASGGLWH